MHPEQIISEELLIAKNPLPVTAQYMKTGVGRGRHGASDPDLKSDIQLPAKAEQPGER